MSEQRKSYLTKSLFLAVAVILIAVVAHQPGYPSITKQIEKSQDLPSGSVEPFFVKSFPDGQGILVAFSNQEKWGSPSFRRSKNRSSYLRSIIYPPEPLTCGSRPLVPEALAIRCSW